MRRALLVLLGLSLFGLTVVVASSFDANTEDLTTFSTQVSISVPGQPLPPEIYLRANNRGALALDLIPPTGQDSTKHLVVKRSDVELEEQAAAQFYVAWRTPPAGSGGYLLRGNVGLFIDQDGLLTDRLTAGLLDCPTSAPDASTGCRVIDVAVADPSESDGTPCPAPLPPPSGGGGKGTKERRVCFGDVNTTIPQGNELRLKVVNQAEEPEGVPVSSEDWRISFGYNPARPSRIEIR